jgi:uncharacterized protein YecE (DUF72 family)
MLRYVIRRCKIAGRAFVGTSGWSYKHWANGVFYPSGLQPAAWLAFYAGAFDSAEINNTFYHLPEPHVFEEWRDRTPAGFTFAVKASRFITHMKKLKEPEQHVARFLTHAAALRGKLGVVLFQLPPFWKFNAARLDGLLAFVRAQTIVPHLRAALEVRHPSWHCDECFEILRRHNTAFGFADWPGVATDGPVTADFIFIRRHGPADLYASGYPPAALRRDAARIRAWLAEGRDVHVYFNNDACGYAVRDARRLRKYLGRPERVRSQPT